MYVNKSLTMENEDYQFRYHDDNDPVLIAGRILFFVAIPLCLAAILADLLLIVVILKYKALKIRCNYYILNYAVCNIGYLASDYILHLSMELFFGGWLSVEWYCTFIQLENYFLNMCLIFLAGYTFDEYILLSGGDYFLYMYKNGYKYIIGGVYPIHFILVFIVSSACFHDIGEIKFEVSFIIVTIVYLVLLIWILKIKYDSKKISYINDNQLNMVLKITLIGFLFLLPMIVYYNITYIVEKQGITKETNEIMNVVACIPEFLAYCTSIVLAYKLFKLNKFFRLAFCKLFCNSRKDMDYSRLDVVPEIDFNG